MTGTRDSRFFVSLLKTNLGMFLFSFSDFSYFSVHSNYSAWIFVGIVASHHQVHNELTALLILFVICRSSTIGVLRPTKLIPQLTLNCYRHVIAIFCYHAPQNDYQARSKAFVEEWQQASVEHA